MRFRSIGLAALTGLALVACSSGGNNNNFIPGTAGSTGSSAGSTGSAAGSSGSAGSTSNAGATGSAGNASAGGSGGTPGTGGSTGIAGSTDGGSVAGADGGAAGAGTGGTGGAVATSDITKVVAAGTGCGKAQPAAFVPGMLVGPQHIMTMGTMAANCADATTPARPPNGATKCGAWQDTRDYWVKLPTGYDNTKPYPILFEGPGCSGHGNNLYGGNNANVPGLDSTVIRVGLSPSAYWQQYHATNPGQGCFDDKNDDSSVDWPFYEALYDVLASEVCFDRNRVFAGGNSSGAWFSNELGCKYAGDAKRPVRGIMPNTGGLPTDPSYVPTCTTAGMAGFWSHDPGDTTNPFSGNIVAMDRALTVDGYTPAGVTYDSANTAGAFDPFPIGTGPNDCRRFKNGSALYPMVICLLPGTGHASHDNVVDPGWPAFINLFLTAPLLTM